jgi:hypothetical protein
MIDEKKYEGHLTGEDDRQTWCWSKWMLKNAETKEQMDATAELLNDGPLLLAEVLRLRERNDKLDKQLTETRRWITMQLTTLKTMVHQAEHVSCTAHNIEEWIGDD